MKCNWTMMKKVIFSLTLNKYSTANALVGQLNIAFIGRITTKPMILGNQFPVSKTCLIWFALSTSQSHVLRATLRSKVSFSLSENKKNGHSPSEKEYNKVSISLSGKRIGEYLSRYLM